MAEIWRESESLEQRFLELTADSKPGDMSPVKKRTTMLAAEIRRIVGRRGSFWSAVVSASARS